MVQLAALFGLILLVFGGLAFMGGAPALQALPMELALIGGAGLATLFIGHSPAVARAALAGLGSALKGPRWRRDDYTALLVLLSDLMRTVRQSGFVGIENDIEKPAESARFKAAPRLAADAGLVALICDGLRLMALDLSNPARAAEHMRASVQRATETRLRAVSALHTLADALPALGIVAAVMGIIRSMSAIDQSPAVLGAMIGSALLGTFLGVFLAYGVIGPLANRFGDIVEEDARLAETAERVLSAFAEGLAPGTALELGRAALSLDVQPDPERLNQALSRARFAARSAAA